MSQDKILDNKYWIKRYEDEDIPWHRKEITSSLIEFENLLNIGKEHTVFFPLCGKSLDMVWVKNKGAKVIGVDCAEKSIEDFFEENNIPYTRAEINCVLTYESKDRQIKILVCDIFEYFQITTDRFDQIVDRGSLVALSICYRNRYLQMMLPLLNPKGKVFYEILEYNVSEHSGPPFCITQSDMENLLNAVKLPYRILKESEYDKTVAKISVLKQRIVLMENK